MNAMLNQRVETVPEIIDFVAFRGALPRGATKARPGTADADRDGAVVVAFPVTPARRAAVQAPTGGAAQAASELAVACALLVDSFHAMHEAIAELQESCRTLDANAGEVHDQAGGVLIGIAQRSATTERFQALLDATIDAAFH
jgi:hypothetical protein